MSTATAGRRVEHTVRHHLEDLGYLVIRAAGSKGPADLIAVRHAVVCVQVKRTATLLRPQERKRLIALANAVGYGLGLPVVATKPPYRPITWRFLTGEGPADWLTWDPADTEAA